MRARFLLVAATAIAAVAYFQVHAYTAPSVVEKSVLLEGVPHVRQKPDFYRRFLAARKIDVTGYATLSSVLGTSDMGAFKKEWEAWVMRLTE